MFVPLIALKINNRPTDNDDAAITAKKIRIPKPDIETYRHIETNSREWQHSVCHAKLMNTRNGGNTWFLAHHRWSNYSFLCVVAFECRRLAKSHGEKLFRSFSFESLFTANARIKKSKLSMVIAVLLKSSILWAIVEQYVSIRELLLSIRQFGFSRCCYLVRNEMAISKCEYFRDFFFCYLKMNALVFV